MAQQNEFNPELFKQVVKSNLDRLVNTITNNAHDKSIMTGKLIITEDENRIMARDYFAKQLAKYLYEYL